MPGDKLDKLLADFKTSDPAESNFPGRFLDLLSQEGSFSRNHEKAHFTASCWVTDPALTRVLLLHHAKLNRWLQPGGHADGEKDLYAVACKELEEETGLRCGLAGNPKLFDLDIHTIPANGTVPEHEHFDVRFHFIAEEGLSLVKNEESRSLAWINLEQVAEKTGNEPSIMRMVRKTKLLKK